MVFCLIGNLGFWEVFIIAGVVLLLFGASRIPKLMRSMGQGVRNFKEGMNGLNDSVHDAEEVKENPPAKNDEEK